LSHDGKRVDIGRCVKSHYDRVYGLAAWYAQRDDPWGKNPTIFNGGKDAEPVDPVIAGLFRI